MGRQLDFVQFHLQKQSVDQILATARPLAKEWNLPTEKLAAWKKEIDAGSENETVLLSNPSTTPWYSVEILPTLDQVKPFRMVFTVSWQNESYPRSPATTRSSK